MQRRHARLWATVAVGLLAGAPVRAEDKHDVAEKGGCAHCDKEKAEAAARAAPPQAAARVAVVDRALVDQDGKTVRFGRDVVAGDIVVMDFVFTTCTTICPLLSAKFARIQEGLGERLGRGAKLVSVSLDPVRDTPARLKAYGAKFRAGPGWTFLTGPKGDVDEVLKGLGAYVPDFTQHPPMVLVGDGKTGRWVRVNGFPDPQKIVPLVDEMLAARKTTAQAGGTRP